MRENTCTPLTMWRSVLLLWVMQAQITAAQPADGNSVAATEPSSANFTTSSPTPTTPLPSAITTSQNAAPLSNPSPEPVSSTQPPSTPSPSSPSSPAPQTGGLPPLQKFEEPSLTSDYITLSNDAGMQVVIIPLGAIVQRIIVPDRNGKQVDVALGMSNAHQYLELNPLPYLGAVIGRVSNRIVGSNFTLDGKTYFTSVNDRLPVPGSNSTTPTEGNYVNDTIHGGVTGFTMRAWNARKVNMLDGEAAILHLKRPDGDQGFPGNVDAWVIYKLLQNRNRLAITFMATTDKATPISLTTHAYFNLNGANSNSSITNHDVTLNADWYTPVFNNTIMPTGQVSSVNGTVFDLRKKTRIADVIDKVPGPDEPTGYDTNYITHVGYPAYNNSSPVPKPELITTVSSPATGIVLQAYSNAPGFQWYTGNHLPNTARGEAPIQGKDGGVYVLRGGFAIEPQQWPEAVLYPNFPSNIVRPGEVYAHQLVWDFSTAKRR